MTRTISICWGFSEYCHWRIEWHRRHCYRRHPVAKKQLFWWISLYTIHKIYILHLQICMSMCQISVELTSICQWSISNWIYSRFWFKFIRMRPPLHHLPTLPKLAPTRSECVQIGNIWQKITWKTKITCLEPPDLLQVSMTTSRSHIYLSVGSISMNKLLSSLYPIDSCFHLIACFKWFACKAIHLLKSFIRHFLTGD